MPNYDGLWTLKIFYTVTPPSMLAFTHTLTLDVNVTSDPAKGEPFSDINATTRAGLAVALQDWLEGLIENIIGFYSAASDFNRAELWFTPEGTFNSEFYSTHVIGLAGLNAGNATPAQQTTFTFRSINGGSGRLQLMETVFTTQTREAYPYANSSSNTLSDYITGDATIALARDNGFFFAPINLCNGQNETLARKRFRS